VNSPLYKLDKNIPFNGIELPFQNYYIVHEDKYGELYSHDEIADVILDRKKGYKVTLEDVLNVFAVLLIDNCQ
jgi:hypothetical protein